MKRHPSKLFTLILVLVLALTLTVALQPSQVRAENEAQEAVPAEKADEAVQTGTITLEKTFSGIEVSQIPQGFKIVIASTENPNNKYELVLNGESGITPSALGINGLSYTWRIIDVPAGYYKITEENADVAGYTLSATCNETIKVSGQDDVAADMVAKEKKDDAVVLYESFHVLSAVGHKLNATNTYTPQKGYIKIVKTFDTGGNEQLEDMLRNLSYDAEAISYNQNNYVNFNIAITSDNSNNTFHKVDTRSIKSFTKTGNHTWTGSTTTFSKPEGTYNIWENTSNLDFEGYTRTTTIKIGDETINGTSVSVDVLATYTEEEPLVIEVSNTYTRDTGKLVITKVFSGIDDIDDLDPAFEMNILEPEVAAEKGTVSLPTVTIKDGKFDTANVGDITSKVEAFTNADGTFGFTWTIGNLPTGWYPINELKAEVSPYYLEIVSTSGDYVEVVKDKTVNVTVKNNYLEARPILTIIKHVTGLQDGDTMPADAGVNLVENQKGDDYEPVFISFSDFEKIPGANAGEYTLVYRFYTKEQLTARGIYCPGNYSFFEANAEVQGYQLHANEASVRFDVDSPATAELWNEYEKLARIDLIKNFKGIKDYSEIPDGFTVYLEPVGVKADRGDKDEVPYDLYATYDAKTGEFKTNYGTISKLTTGVGFFWQLDNIHATNYWVDEERTDIPGYQFDNYTLTVNNGGTQEQVRQIVPATDKNKQYTLTNNYSEIFGYVKIEKELASDSAAGAAIPAATTFTIKNSKDQVVETLTYGTDFTVDNANGIAYAIVKLPANDKYIVEETKAEVTGYAVTATTEVKYPKIPVTPFPDGFERLDEEEAAVVEQARKAASATTVIAREGFFVDDYFTEELPAIVTFTNKYTTDFGYLTITKVVEIDEGMLNNMIQRGEYTFKCDIIDVHNDVVKSVETTSFTKKQNGVYEAVIDNIDLPDGRYEVIEWTGEGYADVYGYSRETDVSAKYVYVGEQLAQKENKKAAVTEKELVAAVTSPEITITNSYTRLKGDLTIRKDFFGLTEEQIPSDLAFVITGPEDFGENGTMTVKYSDFTDGSKKLENIPAGKYTVTETDAHVTGYTRTTYVYALFEAEIGPIDPPYPWVDEKAEAREQLKKAVLMEARIEEAFPAEAVAYAFAEEAASDAVEEEAAAAEVKPDDLFLGEVSDEIDVTVGGISTKVNVCFTNVYEPNDFGVLEITKEVSGLPSSIINRGYTFKCYIKDEKGEVVKTVETYAFEEKTEGSNVYVATIEGIELPFGTYTLEEEMGTSTASEPKSYATVDNYDVQVRYSQQRVTIKQENDPVDPLKVTITNTYTQPGGIGGGDDDDDDDGSNVPDALNGDDHYAYVVGYPDGKVHPEANITRAEVAAIFFRLLDEDVRDSNLTKSNPFSDVSAGQWFNTSVSTMAKLGIVKGDPDGKFRPNDNITRAEFAAIAARFDKTKATSTAKFSDIAGHWAAAEISRAAELGWVSGYPDGTFRPDQAITRAEAMSLINRVLERNPEKPADLLKDMIKWPDNMDTSAWYYLAVQEATNSHEYARKANHHEYWLKLTPNPDWFRYSK